MKRRQGYRKARPLFEKHSREEKESLGIIWGVELSGAEGRIRVIFILLSSPLNRETFIYMVVFSSW